MTRRTVSQTAEQLDRSVATLYDWRYKGIGPKSYKLMGRIVYDQVDIDAWVDAQRADARGDDLPAGA